MPGGLRRLLGQPGVVLAAGAHDALSAKLAEEAGFDTIWASGFGISAVQAVPDANILTLTETLDAVRRICDAVTVPVVADCDNGYGNAINVMRTASEFERAGAAGICIEDNEFPKRCSFYAGVRRDLVAADEHARKIEAACSARRSDDFVVIARTEALIAGLGLDEAMHRARAYAEAGADAALGHSKEPDFEELRRFGEQWSLPVPLVAVPTTYPNVGTNELAAAGFRMAIFANQPLRGERERPDRAAGRGVPAGRRSRAQGQRAPLPVRRCGSAEGRHPRGRVRAAAPPTHPGSSQDDAGGEGEEHPGAPGRGPRPRRHPRRRGRARLQEGAGHGARRALRRQRSLRGHRRAAVAPVRGGGARRSVRRALRPHHLRASGAGEAGTPGRRRRGGGGR